MEGGGVGCSTWGVEVDVGREMIYICPSSTLLDSQALAVAVASFISLHWAAQQEPWMLFSAMVPQLLKRASHPLLCSSMQWQSTGWRSCAPALAGAATECPLRGLQLVSQLKPPLSDHRMDTTTTNTTTQQAMPAALL